MQSEAKKDRRKAKALDEIEQVYNILKDYGFENISIDLVWYKS